VYMSMAIIDITLDLTLATAVHWNECVNRAAILKQGSPSTLMHQHQCSRHRSNGNKITMNHHECDFSCFFGLFQRSDMYLSLIPERIYLFIYLFFKNILPSSDFIREHHTLHKSPPPSMISK